MSVAMCTHNGEAFVAEQLRSILDQEPQPFEIVVSDDASIDRTVQIVDEVFTRYRAAGAATSLRILRNQTALGVTKNFESAIGATHGELIALSDQDDIWHAGRISLVLEAANEDTALLFSSNARLVNVHGVPLKYSLFEALEIGQHQISRINTGAALEELLKRNLITGATAILRREIFELAMPFPESWVHDEWLAIVAALTGTIHISASELIDYRQHGANEIGVRRLGWRAKVSRLLEPRGDRYEKLATRATALANWAARHEATVSREHRELLNDKVEHQIMRAALPANRLLRIRGVLAELRRGGYGRFSRGIADAIRDLVQPAH